MLISIADDFVAYFFTFGEYQCVGFGELVERGGLWVLDVGQDTCGNQVVAG